ncbi:hypothetical protein Nepgr_030023 [Nepenthes gracilis]|uniref:Cytosine-specific methyltransferase n=1 Tax=Nepenthes gracilis TaxID=150966 RepID=A0AAD3TEL7_NEPGR|nr:hypothetical protein Nepgr_030023 [Nepenthes gracilis]
MSSDLAMSEQRCARRSPRLCVDQVNRNSNNGGLNDCDNLIEKKPNKKVEEHHASKKQKREESEVVSLLIGDPIPDSEARSRWPHRYKNQGQVTTGPISKPHDDDEDELVLNVKCHYSQAEIVKRLFNLGDCALVKGKQGRQNYVGRIMEFFKTMDDEDYFRVQWFFRAEDTVINEEATFHDEKRLFISDLMNDNPLDCIVSKVDIAHIPSGVKLQPKSVPTWDFYYDMKYSVDYSTFCTVNNNSINLSVPESTLTIQMNGNKPQFQELSSHKPSRSELALLDVYSGCGGMSTGLCLGAKLTGLQLVTRWALDVNKSACESLKLNHPKTQIRNESAEDFLNLLKEWNKLCKRYAANDGKVTSSSPRVLRGAQKLTNSKNRNAVPSDEYEVASIVDICYGDPCDSGKCGLYFQVRWAGFGPSEDTWEPAEGLSKCQERIQDFVRKGLSTSILPRPGDVDVVCGGPPCQGISGYNQHRNIDSPLDDERNQQIVIFMDIVAFLKPKYVLMENVVDILRFAKGSLGRYALSRLVHLNYQARLGIIAAGCYGLPQFRLRVFLWGAHPNERLPQFPLPTHDVVVRYGAPYEFERNVVAYDEGKFPDLEKALVLSDAISDLPPVENHEGRDEMSYRKPPETEYQTYIRATQCEMIGTPNGITQKEKSRLYDHCPLPLSEDDHLRVRRIPRKKGANFRDLPGVIVGDDNVVRRDPATEIILPSGKQLVPDYAINFCQGKSLRPFARLWWDETVPTVLTRPDPHSQAILHPEQDRVLTIRELARLQGFPDYYRFCGDVKERYCQIGNAVAVPVARALGYALGMAVQKLTGDGHLFKLPPKFSHTATNQFFRSSFEENNSEGEAVENSKGDADEGQNSSSGKGTRLHVITVMLVVKGCTAEQPERMPR